MNPILIILRNIVPIGLVEISNKKSPTCHNKLFNAMFRLTTRLARRPLFHSILPHGKTTLSLTLVTFAVGLIICTAKFMPLEQSRWNQSNIDSLFYAGNQSFINRNFTFNAGISPQEYYFNICQQPINMVTGISTPASKNNYLPSCRWC